MIPVLGAAKFTSYSMLVAAGAVLLHFLLRGLLSGHGFAGAGVRGGVSIGMGGHGINGDGLWLYAVLLALFATVIPSFMLSAGMKRIGANNAAIVTSIGPVSTILQAHFILGDKIFTEQLVGTGLVILALLLIPWPVSMANIPHPPRQTAPH